jgi:prolyl 4-hydroxylase
MVVVVVFALVLPLLLSSCGYHSLQSFVYSRTQSCTLSIDVSNPTRRACFDLRCFIYLEYRDQFGVHQELPPPDDEHYDETLAIIDRTIEYMKEIWTPSALNNRINYKCRNMDGECCAWAVTRCGDDHEEREYMRTNCAPACQTCHLLDRTIQCPIEEGNDPVFGPGDMNAMFERIMDDGRYNPRALSRPWSKQRVDGESDGPWIVLLENFITDEEADALIAAGHRKGYERSTDVGVENPDGTFEDDLNDGRTSTNSWCDVELCQGDPIIMPVIERIATVTSTNVNNSEHIQLLRYEPGQFYQQHHDYIEYQQGLPCGVRMLTLFLYLNDVEEGGGTRFPFLDITVQPRRRSALLWPSSLDEDPEEKDKRTEHEALPVIRGIKYGANAWIHTRNYREAEERDCT